MNIDYEDLFRAGFTAFVASGLHLGTLEESLDEVLADCPRNRSYHDSLCAWITTNKEKCYEIMKEVLG